MTTDTNMATEEPKDGHPAKILDTLLTANALIKEMIAENEKLNRKYWQVVQRNNFDPKDDRIKSLNVEIKDHKDKLDIMEEDFSNLIKRRILDDGTHPALEAAERQMQLIGESRSQMNTQVNGEALPTMYSPPIYSQNEIFANQTPRSQQSTSEPEQQNFMQGSEPIWNEKKTDTQSSVDQINAQDITLRARLVTIREQNKKIRELEEKLQRK